MIWTDDEFKKLKDKKPEILRRFYSQYSDRIYNFLFFKLQGDKFVAEDLANDTFEAAFNSIKRINNKDCIGSWLMQIANRKFIDYLRKKYREKKYSDKINENKILCEEDEIIEKIHAKEKAMMIKIAMEKLKPHYREVLKLKFIELKTQNEIADIIGNTESSVENLLFKAKKKLKNELLKLNKDFE